MPWFFSSALFDGELTEKRDFATLKLLVLWFSLKKISNP
jgi:hypothetical protein